MLKQSFSFKELELFKQKALKWASNYNYCAYLDSNQYANYPHIENELIIGVANKSTWDQKDKNQFNQLENYIKKTKSWVFGHLSYDLKNEIEEKLHSKNKDPIKAPLMYFFKAEIRIQIKINENICFIEALSPESVFRNIQEQKAQTKEKQKTVLHEQIEKSSYIDCVKHLKTHLIKGDLYEINFCKALNGNDKNFNPLEIFERLNKKQKSPFSAYYKIDDIYCLCSSPERFLKKEGCTLISQPIKGTLKREANINIEEKAINAFKDNRKEKAENNMVVDLVRNDMYKTALSGSVKIEELRGIYSFPTLHQCISTITCKIQKEDSVKALKNCFPMASMTGMPKYKALELIEKFESQKRGLFSGSIGYITPDKDFDFNVVIRSILYNKGNGNISLQSGGAITHLSKPEDEYEEAQLKLKSLVEAIS